MKTSTVQVLPVPEGSIIWLHDIAGVGDDPETFTQDFTGELQAALMAKIPHQRYVVLCTYGDATVEVLGPDDLVTRVRAALAEGVPS